MFLGLPDPHPDLLVTSTNPDADPSLTTPFSIIFMGSVYISQFEVFNPLAPERRFNCVFAEPF
jgi:hypothetical protein